MSSNAPLAQAGSILGSPHFLHVKTMLLTLLSVLLLLAAYFPTALSLPAIWASSDTYTHGFFVMPISAYLIYRARGKIASIQIYSSPIAIIPIVVVCCIWLLGNFGGVLLVQQLALIALIPLFVWLLMGRAVVLALLFPLMFLFFMVPVGQNLTQHLMDFTADFAVAVLRYTGFTVHHDGVFITLPVGKFYVAEACSGIRYLIASVTMGALYAYLTYRSYVRRGLFILASIIVPIVANGIRAYLIIIIAHYSNLEYAVGADHLVAGAIFFGIVIFILFWIGRFWREDLDPDTERAQELSISRKNSASPGSNFKKTLLVGVIALVIAGAFPVLAAELFKTEGQRVDNPNFVFPDRVAEWEKVALNISDWQHDYQGMDAAWEAVYSRDNVDIGAHIFWYSAANKQAELINAGNNILARNSERWHEISITQQAITRVAGLTHVTEHLLRSGAQDLLIWRWYKIGDTNTSNPYWGKLLETLSRFSGESGAFGVVVYTELNGDSDEVRSRLDSFVGTALPEFGHILKVSAQKKVEQ